MFKKLILITKLLGLFPGVFMSKGEKSMHGIT